MSQGMMKTIERVTDKMIVAESWRRLGLAFDNKEKDSPDYMQVPL